MDFIETFETQIIQRITHKKLLYFIKIYLQIYIYLITNSEYYKETNSMENTISQFCKNFNSSANIFLQFYWFHFTAINQSVDYGVDAF